MAEIKLEQFKLNSSAEPDDVSNVETNIIVLLFLASCALLFGLVGIAYTNYVQRRDMATRAIEALKNFEISADELRRKFEVLQDQSDRYFASLSEAGFIQLGQLVDCLTEIESQLNELRSRGTTEDYRQALQICTWLEQPGRLPPYTDSISSDLLTDVHNWKARSSGLLVRCAEAVTEGSENTQALGVKRERRSRKATSHIMKDLLIPPTE